MAELGEDIDMMDKFADDDKGKFKPSKKEKPMDKLLKDKDDKDKLKDKMSKMEKDKSKLKGAKDDKEKDPKNKDKNKNKDKAEKKDKVIKDNDKKRKPKKKPARFLTWQSYIHKVLKTVHDDSCTLSSKAMQILDSFANDLFERISTEAVKLLRLNNKKTLTSMEIQTAARLVLPGELCKHAIQDGAKAVQKYNNSAGGE